MVRRYGDELGFLEDVRPKRRVGQFEDVVGSDEVKPGLVFVHGVEYRLQGKITVKVRPGGKDCTIRKGNTEKLRNWSVVFRKRHIL